jgi:membrane protease YdiL (CAAX protease family)
MDENRGIKGMKRDPLLIIVLSVVTCNIYGIYWLYTIGKEINQKLGREAVSPALSLIGVFCCFPVVLYYLYTVDKACVELSGENNVPYQTNFILWLLLTIVAGAGTLFAYFQVQSFLNALWDQTPDDEIRVQ